MSFQTYLPADSNLNIFWKTLYNNQGKSTNNTETMVAAKTPYNPNQLTRMIFNTMFIIAVINGLNLSAYHIPAASLYNPIN